MSCREGKLADDRPAERQLAARGGELIAVARFIPGGRTAVTLSAGASLFPWRRFALFDGAAALLWALYASLLGYFGGKAFEGAAWKGLLLALGIAFAVAAGVEIVRWYRGRPGQGIGSSRTRDPPAAGLRGGP